MTTIRSPINGFASMMSWRRMISVNDVAWDNFFDITIWLPVVLLNFEINDAAKRFQMVWRTLSKTDI